MTTTWPRALDQLQRLHVGTFTGRRAVPPDHPTQPRVRRLHAALDLALPPRILNLDPSPQRADQQQHRA
ncbi:hypothetical protein ACFPM0_37460 [Pseudonocardia sulfidoxydans]|uniref:hypothetical protein n=1 Tax=Pseudonocardia sulfidoxydans TaxID=54011 RepID=UPI003615173B